MATGSWSAQATIRRRLIALRMFYDYLEYICTEGVTNPVVTQRHYIDQGHHLPRDIRQNEIEKLFTAIGDHLRDRTIFTLMLHTGMRVGEVVSLRLADVFLSENRPPYLRVIGKGQREGLSVSYRPNAKRIPVERPTNPKKRYSKTGRKPITITGIQLQL
jgi:site-specific recombinase XerD